MSQPLPTWIVAACGPELAKLNIRSTLYAFLFPPFQRTYSTVDFCYVLDRSLALNLDGWRYDRVKVIELIIEAALIWMHGFWKVAIAMQEI